MQLYEYYNNLSKEKELEGFYECPHIEQNLSPKMSLRPYQREAYARFQKFLSAKEKKQDYSPTHLLFNMATGSGKTLVMAMFILELYQRGYRNFLFFVNYSNIVEKTKQNFLDSGAGKYLFADKVAIGGKNVTIKAVSNFEGVNGDDINICFTTVQGLSRMLTTEKENSISYDDFKNKEIIFLADEAHHLNSNTKNKSELELFESWETQVMRIFKANPKNMLLEFTATVPKDKSVQEKYEDKLIYKYDLKEFRNDKYSKELKLIKTDASIENRMLIACLMNYYRSQVAADCKLDIKPVILFKSITKDSSEANRQDFCTLIQTLKAKTIEKALNFKAISAIKAYIQENNKDINSIIAYLQHTFQEPHLVNMNNEAEAAKNQLLVNSLEEKNNPISGIFAVEKLNEGWDVLNLFDIVRCYETKTDSKETTREAQLIGRGARYFPFEADDQDKYKRKYDDNLDNPLRILEEFHYHAQNESDYITNLTNSLRNEGLFDPKPKTEKIMALKESFLKTDVYQKGRILINKCIEKANGIFDTRRFEDLQSVKAPITVSDIIIDISGSEVALFDKDAAQSTPKILTAIKIPLLDLGEAVIKKALSKQDFYNFHNLKQWLSDIKSTQDFINNYLSKIQIEFSCDVELDKIPVNCKQNIVFEALEKLTPDIKRELSETEGSEFKEEFIANLFRKQKTILVEEGQSDNRELLKNKDWYVYDSSIFSSEEAYFEKLFTSFIKKMGKKYHDIYLLRNDRFFGIYNKNGQRFDPDFVVICKDNGDKSVLYQCFIEPKGAHLLEKDKWKEDFLLNEFPNKPIMTQNGSYKLIGMPFYNRNDGIGQNEFEELLGKIYQI